MYTEVKLDCIIASIGAADPEGRIVVVKRVLDI
jgi:hypothetical protein